MYELVWFIGGAFTYRLLSRLLALTQAAMVFKNIEANILVILASLAEDMSYIKNLRYKSMQEANVDIEHIKKNRASDEEFFEAWKASCIRNIHTSVPNYIKPSFSSWSEGMDIISDFYRDRKNERK
tara:strand:+ start:369 stop:746 length:378 start_codon:yes stop_codon:yes gene_type:complete